MIRTPRLQLIPATVDLARAEIEDRGRFMELLGAQVPQDWPPESAADALPFFLEQLLIDPEKRRGWLAWYGVLLGPNPVLIAGAGFKGPPENGRVETGYSVLPGYQSQGYATEMVGALTTWALDQPGVSCVIADTAEENLPSRRLLARLGFAHIGPGVDPGYLRYEKRK